MAGTIETDPHRYFEWLDRVTNHASNLTNQLDELRRKPQLGPIEEETKSHLEQQLAETHRLLEEENMGPDMKLYDKWYREKFTPKTEEGRSATPSDENRPNVLQGLLRSMSRGQEGLADLALQGGELVGVPGATNARGRLADAGKRFRVERLGGDPNNDKWGWEDLPGDLLAGFGMIRGPKAIARLGSTLREKLLGGTAAAAGAGEAMTEAPKIAGLLEHKPAMVTPERKYLPAPEKAVSDGHLPEAVYDDMLERAVRKGEFPPNAGERDVARRGESLKEPRVGEDALAGSEKLSPPYPGTGDALNVGSKAPLLKEKLKPKKGSPSILGPEVEDGVKGASTFIASATTAAAAVKDAIKHADAVSNNPTLFKGPGEGLRDLKDKLLSPFQTPDFALRKSETGNRLVDVMYEADRETDAIKNSFHYSFDPKVGLRPTGLQIYADAPKEIAGQVDALMVQAERLGSLDKAALALKATPEIAALAKGIRAQDDKLYNEMHTAYQALKQEGLDPNFVPPGYLPEHVPHRWLGRWEVYVNGEKLLKADGTSSFARPGELFRTLEELKVKQPDANIYVKDWASERGVKGFTSLRGRKGAEGFQTDDLKEIWESYFYQGSRFLAMSKAKLAANTLIKEGRDLRPQDITYAKAAIDRMAGRPTWDETLVETTLKQTGLDKYIDPRDASRGIPSDIRRITTYIKLGFGNVGYALFNTFGVAQNVYPMLSRFTKDPGKWTLEGVKGLSDTRLREYLVHQGVIDIQTMEKLPAFGKLKGAEHWIMYLGRKTEEMSRTVAAVARYKLAKSQGLSEADALKEAHRFSAETLGLYTAGGKPAALQGIIGGMGGQFKTYMVVMMQNLVRSLEGKDPKLAMRYIAANVGLAGMYGIIPEADALDKVITESMGFSPKQLVRDTLVSKFGALGEAPLTGVMSALPDLLGHPELSMDWTKRAGINDLVPQQFKDWLGPSLGTLVKVAEDMSDGNTRKLLADLAPVPINNLYRVQDENVVGRRDRTLVRLSDSEKALKIAGLSPKREQREMETYGLNQAKQSYVKRRQEKVVDRFIANPEDRAALEEAQALGMTGRQIQEERNRKWRTALERQKPMLPKILKREGP